MKSEKNIYRQVPRLLIYCLVLLTIVKIILVSREEMIGAWLPHDDLWQVWSAQRWYWGGVYGTDHLYRLPIYPLFIKLISITGVPLRVAIELLYCLSCSLLSIAIFRTGISLAIAIILAFIAIFQPYSFQLFNHFGPEVFLGSLLMLALTYSIQWWLVRKNPEAIKLALISALFWALTWNTRAESIVLLPILITLGCCVAIIDRKEKWKLQLKYFFVGVMMPICLCIILNLTICSINYFRWGLFADSILTAPGYRAAYKSLQAIEVPEKIPYVPITREARQAAYRVSPTFALLKPQLEESLGKMWARVSQQDKKVIQPIDPLEISAGWFFWALYDAAAQGGYAPTAAKGDLFLKQIAEEIQTAFKEHKLSKRCVLVTMIDPDTASWLPRYWSSLQSIYKLFIIPSIPVHNISNEPMLEEDVRNEFDTIANRRNAKLTKPNFVIAGWTAVCNQHIAEVQLITPNEKVAAYLYPTELQKETNINSRRLTVSVPEPNQDFYSKSYLQILTDQGEYVCYSLNEIAPKSVMNRNSSEGHTIYLGCDRLAKPIAQEYWSWKIQSLWGNIFYSMCPYLQWIALIGVIITFWSRSQSSIRVILLLFSTAIIARVLLFALFDATTCSGDQPRYLFAVMPEFSMLLVLGTWLFFQSLIEFIKTKKFFKL